MWPPGSTRLVTGPEISGHLWPCNVESLLLLGCPYFHKASWQHANGLSPLSCLTPLWHYGRTRRLAFIRRIHSQYFLVAIIFFFPEETCLSTCNHCGITRRHSGPTRGQPILVASWTRLRRLHRQIMIWHCGITRSRRSQSRSHHFLVASWTSLSLFHAKLACGIAAKRGVITYDDANIFSWPRG